MYGSASQEEMFIVLTVLLFVFLGIAILVIIDHKAKIPGELPDRPFSISGARRDHPVLSFFTTTILLSIIGILLLEIAITFGESMGLMKEEVGPQLIKKLKEKRVTEKNRHFHNEPVVELVNLGKKPVCFYCHGDFPHSKEPMVRTLLNMHTQFVGCTTCHSDADKIDEKSMTFTWLNYSGIEVTGPPFGTDVDKDTGRLIETDDYYSKIVPYGEIDGENVLLEITEDEQDAKEFLSIRDQLSDEDREAIKKQFHKYVQPKGRFCTRCHTKESKSFLPFRELGFSDQRVSDVTNLNIVGIVQKYKKFYIPNLFGSDASMIDVESLSGSTVDESEDIEVTDNPEAWWNSTFKSSAEEDEERTED